jgi:Eukaryotic aspartyl protease
VASDCGEQRGASFSDSQSSTWHNEGQFSLGLNNLLGYQGVANYGFDTVGLGYTNTTGITLKHQIVAEIISDQYWFGVLGLGFEPTNFSDYGDPQPSFSATLASNGIISSKTWSYTAGAFYRLKSIFGSLILGGYDAARFTRNDLVFTMTGDNFRDIVLTIRSITATTNSGNTTLMSTPEFAFIDSSVPELWLPVSVCQQFEKAFGLQMDNASGFYLINASTHSNLLSANPNFTFTLGNDKTGGSTIDIILPYASFDLNVSAPIYPNGTARYFPLRQGQNDSMYTLGRSFLQEAYVTADYNSRTFNVSQCVFEENMGSQVIAIPSTIPSSSSGPGSGNSGSGLDSGSGIPGGLSTGIVAGITVGAVVLFAIIGIISFCCLRGIWCSSYRHSKDTEPSTLAREIESGDHLAPKQSASSTQAFGTASELPGQDAKVEIAGNPIMHPQELEAEVPVAAIVKQIKNLIRRPSSSSERTTEASSLSQTPEGRVAEPDANRGQDVHDHGLPSISKREDWINPTPPTADRSTSTIIRKGSSMLNTAVNSPTEITST